MRFLWLIEVGEEGLTAVRKVHVAGMIRLQGDIPGSDPLLLNWCCRADVPATRQWEVAVGSLKLSRGDNNITVWRSGRSLLGSSQAGGLKISSRGLAGGDQVSGPGRARRDSAARAMQVWHSQRLLGNGELGDPVIKDKVSVSLLKRGKHLKSLGAFKRKKTSSQERAAKVAHQKFVKPQLAKCNEELDGPRQGRKSAIALTLPGTASSPCRLVIFINNGREVNLIVGELGRAGLGSHRSYVVS
ncbi:AT-rich interactive domain-containing protein 5 [Platanthera guangdongensis]|uniref:AT-rich interactive domain-containing protein 5 n=1 Tax=Platanthera guangdongensis TaxID=2320717 RepID=A0ABR2MFX7_9ASPA